MRVLGAALACCAFALLAADDELSPVEMITSASGSDLQIRVRTNFDEVENCFLITPQEESIQFIPEDQSDDKYQLQELNVLYGCQVTIKNLDENDNGIWQLYYTTNGEKWGWQYYVVTVTSRENGSEDTEFTTEGSTSQPVHYITDLTAIAHQVRIGINVSITLSKQDYIEDCYLETPQQEIVRLEESQKHGVYVYPTSTNFVSCRVVIGPIENELIGTWKLCGKHTEGQNTYERCQPGHITWATNWASSTQANFNHVVSYGFSLASMVRGTGTIITCHVITPSGEDIALLTTSDYPGLQRQINSRDSNACNVTIGPIDEHFIGEWVLYGTYSGNAGFNEAILPMNFFLYGEENETDPYRQAYYNVTTLQEQNYVVSPGGTFIAHLTGAGVRDGCEFTTNVGEHFNEQSSGSLQIATFVNENSAACRLQLGPVTGDMFGEWLLIGKFSRNGLLNELQMPFQLIEEEDKVFRSVEEEDSAEEESSTTTLSSIAYGAKMGVNITISLSKKDYNEDCYIHTPQGNIVHLNDLSINGVLAYSESSNFVSCRVVIGPVDETLLGEWTLCGKHMDGETTRERCQPGLISWAINNPSGNWASTINPNFDHVVHYGSTLDPIVRGTGAFSTCHVVTPKGEDITVTEGSDYPGLERVIYSRDSTICSVRFKVTDANFIGNWILYGTYNSAVIGFNVVIQPMTFFLYDEDDPYSQTYNVTTLDTETHVLMEGNTVTVVVTGSGTRNGCEFVTNSGDTYDQTSSVGLEGVTFVNNNNAACRLQIGPINKDMFGDWRLIGKFIRNNILFNELQLPFRILEEDPANPIPDDVNRAIEYLTAQNVHISFGNSHTFFTVTGSTVVTDSCHIVTPDKLQYILKSDLVLPGFQTVTANSISCGVQVHVNNEDAIGEWTLIARLRVNSVPIERRLPFTIYVEEKVNAVPSVVTVAEGNSLYLRLENPTSLHITCVLKGPTRNEAEHDENFVETCGFIVRDVTMADAGTWEIEYGTRKKYRALINVNVTGRFESPENSVLTWIKDTPINETIGPEDTVFCRIEDPDGLIVFQEFGRCRIILDQVRSEHGGVWKMTIGTVGRVLAETFEFIVKLTEADAKAQVVTSVVSEKPSVMLTCQVASEYDVTACKFRDPSGKVLLANQGVGEDRYSFHGEEISLRSEVSNRVCGLRITNPVVEDLGLWRCVLETSVETYFGFLTVLCPWAMQDPEVAATVVSVPTLTSEVEVIKAVEGNTVIMRCSVQSPIRYCYFRAQNGTVYTVSPGTSDSFEYAGAGFDAGECSIQFPSLQASDSGRWSCNVGFYEHSNPEQRALIEVHIDDLMVADQYHLSDVLNTLVVHSQIHRQHTLEYCRFVRMDGLGFTSDDVPAGYEDHSLLANGKCEIRIPNPNNLEQHPWTVVAKILGYQSELTRSTQHTLTLPEPESSSTDTPNPADTTEPVYTVTETENPVTGTDLPEIPMEHHDNRNSTFMTVWWCVLSVSLVLFIIGLLLGPKRNRQWTYRRAIFVRNSIRRSLLKRPLEEVQRHQTQATPTAA